MDSSRAEDATSKRILAITAGAFLASLIVAGFLYCIQSRRRRRNSDEESGHHLNTCAKETSMPDSINKISPSVKYGTLKESGIIQVPHTYHYSNCDLETPAPRNGSQNRDQIVTVGSNSSPPPCIPGRIPTYIMSSNETGHMSFLGDANSSEANMHQCVICINEFLDEDSVRVFTCGHIFHSSCIDIWFYNKHTWCPLCKTDIYGSCSPINGEVLASYQTAGCESITGQPTLPPAVLTRDCLVSAQRT